MVNLLCKRLPQQAFIILLLFILGGCHLLDDTNKVSVETNYSHYYLWLKSLTEEEIAQEITKQKEQNNVDNRQTNIQLIMLYSLPNSSIHNPYTAKAMLNDYPLDPYNGTLFDTTDLAFIVMLKDQLNQQLLLLEKLMNYKGVYQQSKKVNAEQHLKIDILNKQIIQLKKIEQTLSERGQNQQ